ncbi:MAG TPA: hypothetical protein VGJ74_09820 [Burkholderiales bacterium]
MTRLIVLVLSALAVSAQAMEFRVAGNELHLRGKVEGYEFALLKDALAEHPSIDTIVFRASPGGDAWTAYRVGERIRDGGLRTVLAGPCHSACTIMFLGGKQRHFARAERPEFLHLAFHGTWNTSLHELNNPAIRGRVELRDWVVQRTGGKVEPALLERFLGGERRAAMLYVYDPEQLKRDDGVSMHFCEGLEAKGVKPFEVCEKISGHDAFSMGFVNATERVRVTRIAALPAPFKPKTTPYFPPTDKF